MQLAFFIKETYCLPQKTTISKFLSCMFLYRKVSEQEKVYGGKQRIQYLVTLCWAIASDKFGDGVPLCEKATSEHLFVYLFLHGWRLSNVEIISSSVVLCWKYLRSLSVTLQCHHVLLFLCFYSARQAQRVFPPTPHFSHYHPDYAAECYVWSFDMRRRA